MRMRNRLLSIASYYRVTDVPYILYIYVYIIYIYTSRGARFARPLLHTIVVFWHQLGIHEVVDMYVLNKSQLNTVPLSDYSYEGMAGHCWHASS